MTPTPSADAVTGIARGLTAAGRRWMAGEGAGRKCTHALIRLGLIEPYGSGYHLLPLGLAVRAHLTGAKP